MAEHGVRMQLRSQRRLGTWNVLRLETLIDRDPPVDVTEGNAGNTQVRQDSLHLSESALPKSRFCIQAIVLGVVLTLVMVGLLGFLAFFTRRSGPDPRLDFPLSLSTACLHTS